MEGARFDRLTRVFAGPYQRRWLLAAIGASFAMGWERARAHFTTATCDGSVCANRTMLAGAPSASDSTSSASYPGIGVELSVSCPQDGTPQLLTIRNLSPAPLDVAKVSSLLNPLDEEPFTPTELKILPGITQQLQFGGADGDFPSAIWLINVPIFDAAMNEGARVELRNGQVYFACCDGTGLCYGAGQKPATVVVAARKRRRGHRRKRRRQRRLGRD